MKKIFTITVLMGLAAIYLFPVACNQAPVTPEASGGNLIQAAIIPPGSGSTWHSLTPVTTFPDRYGYTALTFNRQMWVLGGDGYSGPNDAISSSDGVTWGNYSYRAFVPRKFHSSVVFNDQMMIIGGYSSYYGTVLNDTWASPDGIAWSRLSSGPVTTSPDVFSARALSSAVSFIGKIWLFAGYDTMLDTGSHPPDHFKNDCWSSTDGVHWTLVDAHAPFSPRDGHGSVVFGGRMLVIGGKTATGYVNDVWGAKDGLAWVHYTSAAGFTPRSDFATMVYGGAVWVIGGNDGTHVLKDAWYSYDGISWSMAASKAPFSARSEFAGLVFDPATGSGTTGKMWVFPGSGSSTRDDVWYSP